MTGSKPKRRFAESRKKHWTKAELGLVEANRSLLFASQSRGHLGSRSRGAVEERIAELQGLRSNLTGCIGCGCLSLDRSQLANPGDRAAGSPQRATPLDNAARGTGERSPMP
jgi:hypothetical protein